MYIFKKIASVAASLAMMASTVALGAAATFPDPFIKSGASDVAIVFGTGHSDQAAIAALNTKLTSYLTTASVTTTTSSTASGGDFVKLAKSSDNVNLGNNVATVFGSSIDDEDLEVLLADGTYRNDENTEYDYEQKITLAGWNLAFFADSDYKDKDPTIGVRIASSNPVLNYTLDFTTDAESDVSGGDLVDLETTTIKLFGRDYYVSDWDNSTLKVTLLDSANTATAREGETTTVSLPDGKSYEVSINYISTTEVKLTINEELTNTMAEGESYKLTDGTYVGIKDILARDVAGTVGTVEFSLGVGKLELPNAAEIELNDDTVNGIKSYITRGTASGGKETIDKVVIEWTTDDDEFITPDSSLTIPGFGAVKLSAGSFVIPFEEEVMVDYDGDDSIELTLPIKSGTANFNILYANASGEFTGIGKDSTQRLVTSNTSELIFNITNGVDEWFVATYNTTSDAQSYLLGVASISETDNKNRTTFRNKVTGQDFCENKVAGDSCDIGDVSFTINSVYKVGGNKWVNITAGNNVNFKTIYTKEGLRIYLPVDVGLGGGTADRGTIDFNMSAAAGHNADSYLLFFYEENKDDDKGAGTSFNVTINDDSDGDLHVNDVDTGQTDHEILGTDDDTISHVYSDLGTEVKRLVASDRGKAVITYYGSESYGEIFLTDSSASVIGGGTGGGTGQIMAIADTEVASAAGKNLIVIGGSCINREAASLLGVTFPTCTADFTTNTGVASGQYLIQTFSRAGGKVATLVAGYNAADTANGATALTQSPTVDISVGKKHTGSTITNVAPVIA